MICAFPLLFPGASKVQHDIFTWCRKVLAPSPVSMAVVIREDMNLWINLVGRKNEDLWEPYGWVIRIGQLHQNISDPTAKLDTLLQKISIFFIQRKWFFIRYVYQNFLWQQKTLLTTCCPWVSSFRKAGKCLKRWFQTVVVTWKRVWVCLQKWTPELRRWARPHTPQDCNLRQENIWMEKIKTWEKGAGKEVDIR